MEDEDDDLINITDLPTSDINDDGLTNENGSSDDSDFAKWESEDELGDDVNLPNEEEAYLTRMVVESDDSDSDLSSLDSIDDSNSSVALEDEDEDETAFLRSYYFEHYTSLEESDIDGDDDDNSDIIDEGVENVNNSGSNSDREEKILQMHLEQMSAVHNAITANNNRSEMVFLGHLDDDHASEVEPGEDKNNGLEDQSTDMWTGSDSDDSLLLETTIGWSSVAGSSDDDGDSTSISGSDIDDDEEVNNWFDSYDMMFDMDEIEIDSASLALGIAMSMENQAISDKQAISGYHHHSDSGLPTTTAEDGDNNMQSTTVITATTNAQGIEEDPIDGRVTVSTSRSNRYHHSRQYRSLDRHYSEALQNATTASFMCDSNTNVTSSSFLLLSPLSNQDWQFPTTTPINTTAATKPNYEPRPLLDTEARPQDAKDSSIVSGIDIQGSLIATNTDDCFETYPATPLKLQYRPCQLLPNSSIYKPLSSLTTSVANNDFSSVASASDITVPASGINLAASSISNIGENRPASAPPGKTSICNNILSANSPTPTSSTASVMHGRSLMFTDDDLKRELSNSLTKVSSTLGLNSNNGPTAAADDDDINGQTDGHLTTPIHSPFLLKRKLDTIPYTTPSTPSAIEDMLSPKKSRVLCTGVGKNIEIESDSDALKISLDDILDSDAFACPSPPPQTPIESTDENDNEDNDSENAFDPLLPPSVNKNRRKSASQDVQFTSSLGQDSY